MLLHFLLQILTAAAAALGRGVVYQGLTCKTVIQIKHNDQYLSLKNKNM
jgi:hypothetical protein